MYKSYESMAYRTHDPDPPITMIKSTKPRNMSKYKNKFQK